MKRLLILLGILVTVSGCSNTMQKSLDIKADAGPPRIQPAPLAERMLQVPELDGDKMTIAVYSFADKTGQRKPADNIANLSSAVTQGSEVWVIKALSEVGNETWFEAVERVGRVGARYLGVGAQTEYRVDTVTVVMRLVSVSTGKVLLSIATEKTIASSRSGADIFKFLDLGTKLIESETGYSVNEPTNYAVRAAIEAGVVQLVYEGEIKGLWKFKDETRYKGGIPKIRPLPMKDALKKWPESRLYCNKVDLCYPRIDKDNKNEG
jgi:curli production assembly/transport component CsgG